MVEKVSASSITQITASKSVAGRDLSPPFPSTEDLLKVLQKRIVDEADRLRDLPPVERKKVKDYSKTLARAEKAKVLFQRLIREKPDGFKLAPVLYTRTEAEYKSRVLSEYDEYVRSLFFRFLAKNQQPQLKALGLCDFAINRMRRGLEPRTEKGQFYDVNIDHIVERSGCGEWIKTKGQDPDLPPDMTQTFLVNHLANFILLPEQIHDYKNRLNALQGLSDIPAGKQRWALMLVPDMPEDQPIYVCPPQKSSHALHGVRVKPQRAEEHHLAFMIHSVNKKFNRIMKSSDMQYTLHQFNVMAQAENKTVLDIAEKPYDTADKRPLKEIFAERMKKASVVVRFAYQDLREYLPDVMHSLQTTIEKYATRDDATDDLKTAQEINQFLSLYKSKDLALMRQSLAALPLDTARDALVLFEKLDHKAVYLESRELFLRARAKNPNGNIHVPKAGNLSKRDPSNTPANSDAPKSHRHRSKKHGYSPK